MKIRPTTTIAALLLALGAMPLEAQNTATTSGDFDNCTTWGNPTTIFQNITDTKSINTGVTVNAITTGWSTKEIVMTGTGAVSLPTTSYVSFDTDNGADKSCNPCGVTSVTFTYRGSSVTYGVVHNPTTDRCWLDRNLGATQVATSRSDAAAYGHYFQWGRGDDGHQVPTSGTTATKSTTNSPGHGNFITSATAPYDWRNPQNDNLWQGVSGINNPCPSGYRIPTSAELNTERLSWSSNDADGAYASPLKLPMPGFRNDTTALVENTDGTQGSYWGNTVVGLQSSAIYIYKDENFAGAYMSDYRRAQGRPVRCIKD